MRVRFRLERETGVEPATSTLARWRSTAELFPLGEAKDSRGAARGSRNRKPRAVSYLMSPGASWRSEAVPPQWAQTRTLVPPNFFSSAQSSQRGRPVSTHL